jgi:hypothetical protein
MHKYEILISAIEITYLTQCNNEVYLQSVRNKTESIFGSMNYVKFLLVVAETLIFHCGNTPKRSHYHC